MKAFFGVFILATVFLSGVCEAGYVKANEVEFKKGSAEYFIVAFIRELNSEQEGWFEKLTPKYQARLKGRTNGVAKFFNRYKDLDLAKLFKIDEFGKDGKTEFNLLSFSKKKDKKKLIGIKCQKVDGVWYVSG